LDTARSSLRSAKVNLARARVRYEGGLDAWVGFSDRVFVGTERFGRRLGRAAFENPLVEPESKALMRLTLACLLAVFAWILVSCKSLPPPRAKKTPRDSTRVERVEKKPETLWIKRDTLRVKPRDEGSTTGSIWADAATPRELFADEKPRKAGETVTVLIPEDLRYVPEAQDEAGAKNSKGTGKGAVGAAADGKTRDNETKVRDPLEGGFTDPYSVGAAASLPIAPLESVKMEIVSFEPGGDVFLRGVKTYRNGLGETRDVTVFAKVPERLVGSYEVDARDLTQVALTEQVNGQSAEYASTGWDATLSRKLAGYAPDINAELQALEDVRQELKVSQDALKDRARAMADERDRVQKERRRNFEETERLKAAIQGQGSPATTGGQGNGAAVPEGGAALAGGAPQAMPQPQAAPGAPGAPAAPGAPGAPAGAQDAANTGGAAR
jgi:hypothetical protein